MKSCSTTAGPNELNLPKVLNHNEEKREAEWSSDNLINTQIILWIQRARGNTISLKNISLHPKTKHVFEDTERTIILPMALNDLD